ncbi:MAG: hypothetical protein K6E50_01250 [Lachnospiraceae bacterium]|nr:hypothetical protein [Lachnospiraceae bacterium]
MSSTYTLGNAENCLELVDQDGDAIWKGLDRALEKEEPELWKEKLQSIAKEYVFSARFALMRLLLSRASETQLIDAKAPKKGFMVSLGNGDAVTFADITIEHALSLKYEELNEYEALLTDIAKGREDADPERDRELIRAALRLDTDRKSLLSRDESLELGHILGFSLEEMQWFLLRVCDVEGGFRYNRSHDLIEAYGFLTDSSRKEVQEIKAQYVSRYGNVEKASYDEKTVNGTIGNEKSLPGMIAEWPDDRRKECFLEWLGERSPYLDLASKTALTIFRNLAVFIQELLLNEDPDRFAKGFYADVTAVFKQKTENESTKAALYQDGVISEKSCKKLAAALLNENRDFSLSDENNSAKALKYPVLDEKGELKNQTAHMKMKTDGTVLMKNGKAKDSTSTNRICELLKAELEVEKTDILFLLWLMANQYWFEDDQDELTDAKLVKDRIRDLIDAAENCLAEARLPEFYPPHLIEQSMLLSVVYGYKGPERRDPAEVYEIACSSLIKKKKTT